LKIIKKNNHITINELSIELDQTTRSIEKIIAKLKKEGLLERVGGRKEGHWEIIENN